MPIFFWNVAGAFVVFIPTCLVLDVVYTDSHRALPFPALSELGVDLGSFPTVVGLVTLPEESGMSSSSGPGPPGGIIPVTISLFSFTL